MPSLDVSGGFAQSFPERSALKKYIQYAGIDEGEKGEVNVYLSDQLGDCDLMEFQKARVSNSLCGFVDSLKEHH